MATIYAASCLQHSLQVRVLFPSIPSAHHCFNMKAATIIFYNSKIILFALTPLCFLLFLRSPPSPVSIQLGHSEPLGLLFSCCRLLRLSFRSPLHCFTVQQAQRLSRIRESEGVRVDSHTGVCFRLSPKSWSFRIFAQRQCRQCERISTSHVSQPSINAPETLSPLHQQRMVLPVRA
ncbi:hypothetical protein EI94DRAFT_818923 [Lactarius quietus]|nr:hypothetical protein EI94DRAFT_818923 [Lactarius quietus]